MPVGDEAHVGSRYAMRMHVGSADVGGLIEVVECEPAEGAGLDEHHRHRPARPLAAARGRQAARRG